MQVLDREARPAVTERGILALARAHREGELAREIERAVEELRDRVAALLPGIERLHDRASVSHPSVGTARVDDGAAHGQEHDDVLVDRVDLVDERRRLR